MQKPTQRPINEIELDNRSNWREKHARALELSYRKAPHFGTYWPELSALYEREWTHLAALNRFMQEGPTISGAYLSIDNARLQSLYSRLKEMPRVAGVTGRVQEIRNFNRVMQETMLFFTYVATVFSIIIAFGVIYNSARIALTERGRELASLRVLGFTRAEIAYILLGELGLLALFAIPLGLWLGRGMCYYIARTMQSDLFRVPVVLAPQTYAFAATVVLVSALLSGLAVRRRLDQLDLIAVLKAAE